MTEVKHREDEYDRVKDISSRLEGLPSTVQLARRERRLLAHGLLRLAEGCIIDQTGSPTCDSGEPEANRTNLLLPSSSLGHQRTSRLFEAVNELGVRRGRSASVKSTASSALSFKSYESQSTTESALPITPSSGCYPDIHSNVKFPLQASESTCGSPRSPPTVSLGRGQRDGTQCSDVYLFVFTDFILLTTPSFTPSSGQTSEPVTWRVLDKIGVSRVVGVAELSSGMWTQLTLTCKLFTLPPLGSRSRILLDLLAVDPHDLDSGMIQPVSLVTTLQLALPEDMFRGDPEIRGGNKRPNWVSALQQCFQCTLRMLSFPSNSGEHLMHNSNMDLETDTHHSTISILNAGLPLPKSPSFRMEETFLGQVSDTKQQEREERGWWALRFQQVYREIQRQEISISFSSA
jgi:hypothetical protein